MKKVLSITVIAILMASCGTSKVLTLEKRVDALELQSKADAGAKNQKNVYKVAFLPSYVNIYFDGTKWYNDQDEEGSVENSWTVELVSLLSKPAIIDGNITTILRFAKKHFPGTKLVEPGPVEKVTFTGGFGEKKTVDTRTYICVQ